MLVYWRVRSDRKGYESYEYDYDDTIEGVETEQTKGPLGNEKNNIDISYPLPASTF